MLYKNGLDNYLSVALAQEQAIEPLDYSMPAEN